MSISAAIRLKKGVGLIPSVLGAAGAAKRCCALNIHPIEDEPVLYGEASVEVPLAFRTTNQNSEHVVLYR